MNKNLTYLGAKEIFIEFDFFSIFPGFVMVNLVKISEDYAILMLENFFSFLSELEISFLRFLG